MVLIGCLPNCARGVTKEALANQNYKRNKKKAMKTDEVKESRERSERRRTGTKARGLRKGRKSEERIRKRAQ